MTSNYYTFYLEHSDGANLFLEDVLEVVLRDKVLFVRQSDHEWGFPLHSVKVWRVGGTTTRTDDNHLGWEQ